jgi:hypothetical protein
MAQIIVKKKGQKYENADESGSPPIIATDPVSALKNIWKNNTIIWE